MRLCDGVMLVYMRGRGRSRWLRAEIESLTMNRSRVKNRGRVNSAIWKRGRWWLLSVEKVEVEQKDRVSNRASVPIAVGIAGVQALRFRATEEFELQKKKGVAYGSRDLPVGIAVASNELHRLILP